MTTEDILNELDGDTETDDLHIRACLAPVDESPIWSPGCTWTEFALAVILGDCWGIQDANDASYGEIADALTEIIVELEGLRDDMKRKDEI